MRGPHAPLIPAHAKLPKEIGSIYTAFVFSGHSAIARGRPEDFEVLKAVVGPVIEDHDALYPDHERLDWFRRSPFFGMYSL